MGEEFFVEGVCEVGFGGVVEGGVGVFVCVGDECELVDDEDVVVDVVDGVVYEFGVVGEDVECGGFFGELVDVVFGVISGDVEEN